LIEPSDDRRPRAPGDEELDRRAADLTRRLPASLAPLARIAYNYRWCWYPDGKEVFRSIDPGRWDVCGENPVRLLREASGESLARAAADHALLARVAAVEDAFAADLDRAPAGDVLPERPIAFLCAEYGVHQSLPVYAGGLGGLAGDLLKEASDRALPLVSVGLLYRQGYFRQRLDATGWQHEYWIDVDPERLPAALVRAPDGGRLTITVRIFETEVKAQIWRVAVGRVPLFLLDADLPENGLLERWITSQLYVADPVTRLSQYVLLGVGGLRALAAMGIEPGIVHLNEGHAGFAVLEHLPSWMGPPMRRLLDGYLGEGWWRHAADVTTWERLEGVPDAELWAHAAGSARSSSSSSSNAAGSTASPSASRARRSKRPRAHLTPTSSPWGSRGATRPTTARTAGRSQAMSTPTPTRRTRATPTLSTTSSSKRSFRLL
jgi:uncharacterized protein DUF3417